jgi:ubiquilin
MVKSAAVSSTSSQSQPQRLPNMQAGQNPHDPLTQLNSHLGYGALAGVNPFADMGLNQNDPNMVCSLLHRPHRSCSPISRQFQSMMNSPQFLQQMASLMSNPAVVDQIIASNPDLVAMGPQVRDIFQSERFQEMMLVPTALSLLPLMYPSEHF